MPRDRPFRLVVVGHPKFGRYQRQAEQLGVRTASCSSATATTRRTATSRADFLVHPTFYDPCSLVALEALACGLPVVTTRYNGASELLTPPNDGVVIDDPHDANELASAMYRFTDRTYRAEASSAARQTGAKWTFEHHYQALLYLFAQVREIKQAA